ncbi:MAG: signal peptide peptidase SppA [Nannocystales bacterium]
MKTIRTLGTGALALSLSSALATTTSAAPPEVLDRATTDGVERVYEDYSSEGDASSLELNPAMLSAVRGFDLTLLGYQTTDRYMRGQGFGAFAAFNLGFGFAMGFGAQLLEPGLGDGVTDFDADANPTATKLSWGLSLGMGEFAALGVGVAGLRTQGQWLQRPDLDIGLMTRVTNYASLGASARLSPVNIESDTLPPELSVVGELSVRPLGTNLVELAGGVRQQVLTAAPGERTSRVGTDGLLPRGRLSLRWQGWGLRGEVEQVRLTQLDEASFVPLRTTKGLRGSVSLEASWDFASIGSGVHVGASDGVDGVGYHARLHSRRRGRVFWPRLVRVERIDLGKLGGQRSLISMLDRLERAEKAGPRTILLLDARNTSGGWAARHEVRDAIIDVRNAGGHVFAYVENAGLGDYYMASVAESVFIHPAGALDTHGMSSDSLYFRGALDKVGVKAEVIKIREYKSAGERFSETGPSAPDREQREALQSGIYKQVLFDIASARGLSVSEVRQAFDNAPYGPTQAIERKLVDAIAFRDELEDEISDDIGAPVEIDTVDNATPQDTAWGREPYIAVVLVEGAIVDGPSRAIPIIGTQFAGGDTIAKTLRTVRADNACKGIVLRVDSPGGSALASDIIWREVARTQEAFEAAPKDSPPIVVSMSNVAASGGYYVAMGTDTVFVDPMTITGSIGVITIHFDLSGLLEKLGISVSTFKQGNNPGMGSLYRPYTDAQRKKVEDSIGRVYDLFTSRVAEARGMTQDKVNELGRGHVYGGKAAIELKLADREGGLEDAVNEVRSKAGIKPRKQLAMRVLPRSPKLLDLILDNVGDPFTGSGPVRKAQARRKAAREQASISGMLPSILHDALAQLPLSLLYLEQGKVHAVMPYVMPPPE